MGGEERKEPRDLDGLWASEPLRVPVWGRLGASRVRADHRLGPIGYYIGAANLSWQLLDSGPRSFIQRRQMGHFSPLSPEFPTSVSLLPNIHHDQRNTTTHDSPRPLRPSVESCECLRVPASALSPRLPLLVIVWPIEFNSAPLEAPPRDVVAVAHNASAPTIDIPPINIVVTQRVLSSLYTAYTASTFCYPPFLV